MVHRIHNHSDSRRVQSQFVRRIVRAAFAEDGLRCAHGSVILPDNGNSRLAIHNCRTGEYRHSVIGGLRHKQLTGHGVVRNLTGGGQTCLHCGCSRCRIIHLSDDVDGVLAVGNACSIEHKNPVVRSIGHEETVCRRVECQASGVIQSGLGS